MTEVDDDIFTAEDNSESPQMEGFPLAPPGWYVAAITSTEKKKTKDGSGAYLNLRIEILEGPEKGCSWFEILNLWNASPKAVKIARGQLACFRNAVGKTHINSSKELLDIPFRCSVGIKKGDQGYRDKNYTKDAEPANVKAASKPKAVATPSMAGAAPTSIEDDEVPSFG